MNDLAKTTEGDEAAAAGKSACSELLYCSFCGLSSEEVSVLIAAPGGVNICDSCVAICNDIIEHHKQ